ncbi:MAG: energy-coupling factor transporter transmembrane component T [Candidatus Neomarinimicrobiota bacterium]
MTAGRRSILYYEHNPLVRIILALAGVLAVSLSTEWRELAYTAVTFLALTFFLSLSLRPVLDSVRLMLPWTLLFFAIHVGFTWLADTGRSLVPVLAGESIILLRFIGLSAVMGVLRVGLSAQRLVDSLKTLLDRTRRSSPMAEDLLQTFRLILVFIPQVQREYRGLERFNRALGFAPPATLPKKVRFYGGNLLPVLSRSLDRAEQLGEVMVLRDYGRVVPRGQLSPLPFRTADTAWTVCILLLLGSGRWLF